MDKLGKKYNYSLIYCNANGVNSFLIHNDLIKDKNLQFKNFGDIAKIYKPAKYGSGPNGGHKQDLYNRQYISFEEAIDNHNDNDDYDYDYLYHICYARY